jgi:hypothetical protein
MADPGPQHTVTGAASLETEFGDRPSPYMARRVGAALVILTLAWVGVANPWNLVVVDRMLNHFFAASIIVTVLMLDVLRRGDAHPRERTPAVGRLAIAVLVAYWLVLIWVSPTWPSAAVGAVTAVLMVITLVVNQRTNRLTWPLQILAIPLLIVGALSIPLGGFGYVMSDHGAPAGVTNSPFTDARIDAEQVDGACPGITNWLRRGSGLGAREVHLGGDCADFRFAAPDRLELDCYRMEGKDDVEYAARTIAFDPATLHIYSDTGEVQYC